MKELSYNAVGRVYKDDADANRIGSKLTFSGAEYTFVKFASGTYVRKGEAVYYDTDFVATLATQGNRVMGVATCDVDYDSSDAQYAFVQSRGFVYPGVVLVRDNASPAVNTDYDKVRLIQSSRDGAVENLEGRSISLSGDMGIDVDTGIVTANAGTAFSSEVQSGDIVSINGGGAIGIAVSVTNDNSMILACTAGSSNESAKTAVVTSPTRDIVGDFLADGETENADTKTLTGTVALANSDATVTGTNTIFDVELRVGDQFSITDGGGNTETKTVASITNNTSFEANAAFNADAEISGSTLSVQQLVVPAFLL